MQYDFAVAAQTVHTLHEEGYSLRAVWFDCLDCCGEDMFYVGAGQGAPNLILSESGLTNIYSDVAGSWACVSVSEVLAADPDIMIVVDAGWDTAIGKIEYLHNRTDFCDERFVQHADYIKIPFSASTLGPRNGAAALDMITAATALMTGNTVTMNFESGVTLISHNELQEATAGLLCPAFLPPSPPPPAPPSGGICS